MTRLHQWKAQEPLQQGLVKVSVPVLWLIFLSSIMWSWWRTNGSVVLSQDEGANSAPLLGMVLVAGLTLMLIRLIPVSSPSMPPSVKDRRGVHHDLILLLICAVIFPLTAFLPGPEEYFIIWKVLLLIMFPVAYFKWKGGSSSIKLPRTTLKSHTWPVALIPIAAYILMTQFGPLAPAPPAGWPDLTTLVIAAVVTAITAGVGEEIFYRYWLQSRVEAVSSRWVAILLVSLMYGLMHVGTHGGGLSIDVSITTVIASQGVFGIVLGYLWSRYRTLWICILLHILNNGMLVFLHLLGLA